MNRDALLLKYKLNVSGCPETTYTSQFKTLGVTKLVT
jgi:hypothetical protein